MLWVNLAPAYRAIIPRSKKIITNPPSSVETSRVEADETTTTTTTANNTTVGQSTSVGVTLAEEKETTTSTTTTATESATKSSLSVTPTKGDATVAAGSTSTSKSSPPPKKDMLKREESSSTSSSSLKTTDSSEVDSCTVASAMNTAEEINMYTTNARKFNGISSTSEGSELDIKSDGSKVHKLATTSPADESKVSLSSTVTKLDLSGAISTALGPMLYRGTSAEQQYEVSVWYEGKDLQFLSVERIHSGDKVESSSSFERCITAGTTAVTQDASSIIDSSSKQSSSTTNGSVSSLGPFTLAQNRASLADSVAHSSDSSSTSGPAAGVHQPMAKSSTSTLSVPQVKQTVIEPRALCDLLIDEFKKLRRTFAPDVKDEEEEQESHHRQEVDEQLLHTPKASGSAARGQRAGGSSTTSKKSAAARGQKRTKAAVPISVHAVGESSASLSCYNTEVTTEKNTQTHRGPAAVDLCRRVCLSSTEILCDILCVSDSWRVPKRADETGRQLTPHYVHLFVKRVWTILLGINTPGEGSVVAFPKPERHPASFMINQLTR
ncbi:AGAP001467-PA-like protein [Anopheles sinensis]|uniref:AGAP001467-PA-like protein n=1 Tax=Anopheles sinensis TaxID=74873 RepID=A0A084VJ04_ANOSI|nr:AGAP001467-PA-like protein [Anopheles sinensis]